MSRVSHGDAGKPRRLSPLHHGMASQLSGERNYDEKVLPDTSYRTDQQASAMTESKLTRFIWEQKIEQLECNRYVTDPKSEDGNCYCGRKRRWHEKKSLKMNHTHKQIWDRKTHTRPSPSQAYGEIQFQGFGKENIRSPYIRLSSETEPDDVFDLLIEHWKLPPPKLLISVTGGTKMFKLSEPIKTDIKKRLIKSATSTGAWIITSGRGRGVMQLVGEAVREHMVALGGNDTGVVAIGFFNWGCITKRKALKNNKSGGGLFPAQYSRDELKNEKRKAEEQGEIEEERKPQKHKKPKPDRPLDHNQTHFILVDDGTKGKPGGEVKFRVKFEKYVSETKLPQTQDVNVPAIMLVVEGGVYTIEIVHEAIKKNIPVLVINGTGRAADFIAKGYELSKDRKNDDRSTFREHFDEDMKAYACEKLYKDRNNSKQKISESLKQLKDFLEKRWLVSVSEADNDDIDGAILDALIKVNKMNAKVQLALTLVWDRCDIARDHILTKENLEDTHLYDTMVTALVQDNKEFVQLLCENGVSLHKFLNKETLWNLYKHALTQDSPISELLKKTLSYNEQPWWEYLMGKKSKPVRHDSDLLQAIGRLLAHLLKDDKMKLYNGGNFIVEDCKPTLDWTPGTLKSVDEKTSSHDSVEETTGIIAERELFIWAILSNRRELGEKFWRSCPEQLGAALVGSALLKALEGRANKYWKLELHKDLNEHSKWYEDRAVGVLDECYTKNEDQARRLLIRRLSIYGDTRLFSLARTFDMMRFTGTTCCQTMLDLIWVGCMEPYTQSWKIILSVFLPCFIRIIDFKSSETDHEKKESEGMQDDSKETTTTGAVEKDERPFKIMCSTIKQCVIDIWWALVVFYTAPVTLFITNTISYLVFLSIFTYFVLTDLHPSTVSTLEYITWGWAITIGLEEIRQICDSDRLSWKYKILDWLGSVWNLFDLAMIIMFLLSVIMRFIMGNVCSGDYFVYARIPYSITLAMYYLRFMQTFFVQKNMGPKVIMIKSMLADLSYLCGIFIVFMLSFGVIYQANLFPNSPPSWYLLKYVIYIPYWQMYGELFLEDMEGDPPDSCTTNETIWRAAGGRDRCPEKNAIVPLLAALYMIVIHIILVNLLIAMFSTTYQAIQNRSEQVSRYYRFSLVSDYMFQNRPVLPLPLNILASVCRLCKTCCNKKNSWKSNGAFDDNENELRMFEQAATESYEIKMADTASRKQSDLNIHGREVVGTERAGDTIMFETLNNMMAEQQRQGQQLQKLLEKETVSQNPMDNLHQ